MSGDKGQTRDNVPTCPHTKGQGTNWGQIGDIVPSRGQGTLGPLHIRGRLSPSLPARVTTSGDTRRQHSATHSPDFTHTRYMAQAFALRPANANGAGKANRGWLTTERAKALGKIGGDKFAASKRGRSLAILG